MKKIVWFVLLAMLVTCLAACGGNSELEKSFTTIPVDGGVKIVGYSGNHTVLEIPSTIKNKKVVAIGDEVFADSYLLTEIVIPDTVKVIGNRAFKSCLALEKIVIPDSVTEIGDYAFFGCWVAKSIEIGAGLNKMGNQAIQYCKSLETITVSKDNKKFAVSDDGVLFTADYKTLLCYPAAAPMTTYTVPSNCTEIRDYAFRNCVKLETLIIGEHVTEMGDSIFYGCEKLREVKLNASIDYLGYNLFANCVALEEIVIPEGVEAIGYLLENGECGSTFFGCTSLRSVVFPKSLTNIYASSFYDCPALTEIGYCGSEADWSSVVIGQGNEALTGAKVTCEYQK